MSEPGELRGSRAFGESRGFAAAEVAAVVALALIPLPEAVPVALPLLVAATLARWLRGLSWAAVARGPLWRGAVGAAAGAVGLALAIAIGTPLIEASSQRAIEWSAYPVVRGNAGVLALLALHVAVTALATELALRGWIVERMLELSPGPATFPVAVGAVAEALITPGDLAARCGALLFGAGLGAMYVAAGRSVLAPVCARVVFQVGALVLEATRVIG